MKVAVLGGNGFIGKGIQNLNNPDVELTIITRDNYREHIGSCFDVFINSAGNKRAYIANQYPAVDFVESTVPVYKSLFDFKFDKYVFISSIAAYDDKSHYGFNKRLSEEIVERHAENNLILRPCNIIDKDMEIGVIADIKYELPLFLTMDSKMQFITRSDFVRIMFELINLDCTSKINIGGNGCVTVKELQDILQKNVIVKDDAIYREYNMDVSSLLSKVELKSSKDYVLDVLN